MSRDKVLALIMAGGEGSRMDVLTRRRAKPVLPYGGMYRLIDFPLSNCVHSGISDVWIIEQYQPYSLNEHLANGRPWDLDRTHGGLRLLQPHQGGGESGWHQGNADAIYKNRREIRAADADLILVLSADHVYKLDYRAVIDAHRDRDAGLTLVTTRVPREQAGRFGTVKVGDMGRVTAFEYKPESPPSDLVTTEVFVYDARTLLETLDTLAAERGTDEEGEQESLEDFGDLLVPRLVQQGQACEYRLEGYWRDVGTPESYWRAHMDLRAVDPKLNLDDPRWPIFTPGIQRGAARVDATARIETGLISPACAIRGHVAHSVLGPGVVVEDGATVRSSILLGDCVVGAGATVDGAILDEGVRVGRAEVGERRGRTEGAESPSLSDSDLVLVGQGAHIADGSRIPAGGHVEPA